MCELGVTDEEKVLGSAESGSIVSGGDGPAEPWTRVVAASDPFKGARRGK